MQSVRSCLQMPLCHGVDIEEKSIAQLQNHMQREQFTSNELTLCYLKRTEKLNPRIKAVIEINPHAVSIAAQLDTERREGNVRSKIHGIPFLVKDNIATNDGMQTTAGSAALVGTIVPNDAPVVALLRAAGGVLLGRANLSEWACMRSSYYSEAYSSRGGQGRNPYNLAEHPGGSSSGSASAVAANMCTFSIGTETDGSIMFPADRNAVVGIKPTVGLTSTWGVIPEAPSLDTVGVFGRSVEDVATVLDIIADKKAIPETSNKSTQSPTNQRNLAATYTSALGNVESLNGATFGLPRNRVWETAKQNPEHPCEYAALVELTKKMKSAGAHVFEVDFPSAEEIISPDGWDWEYAAGEHGSELSEFTIVKTEFRRSLGDYLKTLGNNKKNILTLEDVVAYNLENTAREGGVPGTHPAWPTGQDNFDKCLKVADNEDEVYRRALNYNRLKSRDEGIDVAMRRGDDKLDGLLVPLQADGGAAFSIAAKAGYPMITIPVGVNENGIPFGIGIIQLAWKEDQLIRYGAAIEDLVRNRHRPAFLNFDADNYTYIGTPPSKSSEDGEVAN